MCEGGSELTDKQRRQINSLHRALNVERPDLETIGYEEAEEWIERHGEVWMQQPLLPKLTEEEYMYWTQAARR